MSAIDDTAGARASSGPGGGTLVLVVDNNPDTLVICRRALESAGDHVGAAISGEEALARIDDLRPRLVGVDVALPGGDGFAIARAIRARPASAAVPILDVLTIWNAWWGPGGCSRDRRKSRSA